MSNSLDINQAQIDTHLQSVAECLASTVTELTEDTTDSELLDVEPGSRIAAKVIHLQNRIATLPPMPATAESDQCSFFDLFFSGVEGLWGDSRERDKQDTCKTPERRRVAPQKDSQNHRRSQECLRASGHRHRRAGSSKT